MDLLAIGGDKRYAYMVREANKRGISAFSYGLDKAGLFDVPEIDIDRIGEAKCMVMPNPFGKTFNMPFSKKTASVSEILSRINSSANVMLFGSGDVENGVLEHNNIVRLDNDDILMNELARQTAEGAIHSVCERAAYELYDAKVLIVGYGKLGKALHGILRGFRSTVVVAARREESRCEAAANGALSIDMTRLDEALGLAHIVFSTPPERVIDAKSIGVIHRNALLVDLSSAPYGVDIEAARSRWLHAWREPALPGRYCPYSAGKSMLDAVIRSLGKEGD